MLFFESEFLEAIIVPYYLRMRRIVTDEGIYRILYKLFATKLFS